MSALIATGLVVCAARRIPSVVKCNVFGRLKTDLGRFKTTFDRNSLAAVWRTASRPYRPTAAKSILFGFSLLGLFGLDEVADPELKLVNTIKRGLLYLQVNVRRMMVPPPIVRKHKVLVGWDSIPKHL